MAQPSSSRVRLIAAMRRSGGCTVSALRRETALSRSTVRRHLDALARSGAIAARTIRSRTGRPTQVFSLTAPMELAAAGSYPALLEALFARLRTMQPEQIEATFPAIARLLAGLHPEIRRLPDAAAKLDVARQVVFAGMDASAVARTDEGIQFSIHECPLAETALEFRELCCAARAILSGLTGQDVGQTEWIIRGDPRCTFEIRVPTQRTA
jgi:predicted ArsR family transcriptional regulator